MTITAAEKDRPPTPATAMIAELVRRYGVLGIALARLTIIDYIVVHKLRHMRYRDHFSAFWNEVAKVLPDYQRRKEWLRVRGVELDL